MPTVDASEDDNVASMRCLARTYAHDLGWAVFPCWTVQDGTCTCPQEDACSSPGKHPATAKGFKDATTNEASIGSLWSRHPDSNIGIATGPISGIVVLDVDPGHGGDDSLAELERTCGRLPDTVESITGGGGRHIFFQIPDGVDIRNSAGNVGDGLDIRANGGYVIAPPSQHISGGQYEWEGSSEPWDVALAQMPDWLIDIITKPEPVAVKPAIADVVTEGGRNDTMASLADTMRSKGMSEQAITLALLADNAERCRPPLLEAEVRAIATSISRYEPSSPPIIRNNRPEPVLDEAAFYGIAGEVVRAIEPNTEADPAALLGTFLTMAGNVIGRAPHAVAEAARHGTNLNIVVVGDTAKGRKGSSYNHMRELFSRVDAEWTKNCISGGLASGEGLIWAVRDRVEKTQPIKKAGRATGEYEAVVTDEGVLDKRLLAVESEFAAVLKVATRDGNTLSSTMRQAWDDGNLNTLTKNSPAKATNAHISTVAHITKDELLRYLTDTEAGNGFANRFLWLCAQRRRVLPEGGGDVPYATLVPRLHEALEAAKDVGLLARNAPAIDLWAEVYTDLSEGKSGLFGAITARAEAQVLRLSVIYAALDGDDAIRVPHLVAALAVWQYAEQSAAFIFGDATGDPVADRILASLRSTGELPRTQISNLLGRNVKAERIDQALDLLARTHKAHRSILKPEGNVKATEVWHATQSESSYL